MTDGLKILPYASGLAHWFERLNVAWLEKYFYVEEIDKKVLRNPESEIIAHGGAILFGEFAGEIVGTCALKHHGEGVYELTKMAVTDAVQGKGFGRQLLNASIDRYRELSGTRLYLESHHSLVPALKLYESGGFEHAPRPPGLSLYERSDVYMVFRDSMQA